MTEAGDSLGSPERTIVLTVSFRAGVEPGPYGLGAFNSRGSANDRPAGTPKLLTPNSSLLTDSRRGRQAPALRSRVRSLARQREFHLP